MWKLNQKSILCVQMQPLSWIQLWGKLQKQTSMRIFGWYTTVLPSTVVMLPRIQSIPSSCAVKTPHHFSSALSYSNGIQLKILLLFRKENPISSSVSVDVTKIIVLKVKPQWKLSSLLEFMFMSLFIGVKEGLNSFFIFKTSTQ